MGTTITIANNINKKEKDVNNIIIEDEKGSIITTAVIEAITLFKKIKKFIIKVLRPNIYVGIYYSDFYK